MLTALIVAVVGLAILAVLRDYRFMSALKTEQPDLYRTYGGHTFLPAPRRFRMISAVVFGGYKAEVTNSRVRALASQLRAVMLIFVVVLVGAVTYVATIDLPFPYPRGSCLAEVDRQVACRLTKSESRAILACSPSWA